jgi:hypothetical protein
MIRHEIPTHLSVEDRALLGLTLRQVLHLLVGAAAGYAVWTHLAEWPQVPPGVRLATAGLCFLAAAAFALLRPYGRGLGDWLLAAIGYAAAPRRSVWRSRCPDGYWWAPARLADAAWEEIAPPLSWCAAADEAVRSVDSENEEACACRLPAAAEARP